VAGRAGGVRLDPAARRRPGQQEGGECRGGTARYRGLIAALARHRGSLGALAEAFDHFRKVTKSYWPGLFRSYDVAGLPRTNNDLEQFFGSYRYHERRCSGRKVASPGTEVRGSVSCPTCRRGESCATDWDVGRPCGRWAAASDATRGPTSGRLRTPSSNSLCRPRFFLGD